MIKPLLIAIILSGALSGCNTGYYDNDFSGNQVHFMESSHIPRPIFATILSVQRVNIPNNRNNTAVGAIGGAAVGGLLGNAISNGQLLGTTAGILAGGLLGHGIQNDMNSKAQRGVRLVLQRDGSYETMTIIQRQSAIHFSQGQRVVLINNGGNVTVKPVQPYDNRSHYWNNY